jgi:hypothetical protein
MSDLLDRAPGHALMEKVISLRGTPDVALLPLGIVRVSRDGLNWIRGVNGEWKVAARLERLGRGWTVLHSIPVGERGSDIDHVVIGPAGVFPINSKRLVNGTVWVKGRGMRVNGQKRDYLRNSEFEATRVDKVLRAAGIVAPVVPLIVISGAKRITVKSTPTWNGRNIGVASVEDVVRRIHRRPAQLSSEQVDRIVEVFGNAASWSRREYELSDAGEVRAAYNLIDRGVDRWNWMVRLAAFAIGTTGVIVALNMYGALTP